MKKTIVDSYIVAFTAESEDDTEYERLKVKFFDHDAADDGYTWAMTEDEEMIQVQLPDTDQDISSDEALEELTSLLGLGD